MFTYRRRIFNSLVIAPLLVSGAPALAQTAANPSPDNTKTPQAILHARQSIFAARKYDCKTAETEMNASVDSLKTELPHPTAAEAERWTRYKGKMMLELSHCDSQVAADEAAKGPGTGVDDKPEPFSDVISRGVAALNLAKQAKQRLFTAENAGNEGAAKAEQGVIDAQCHISDQAATKAQTMVKHDYTMLGVANSQQPKDRAQFDTARDLWQAKLHICGLKF